MFKIINKKLHYTILILFFIFFLLQIVYIVKIFKQHEKAIKTQITTIETQTNTIKTKAKQIEELQKKIQQLKNENSKLLKLKTTVKYDIFTKVSNIIDQHNKSNTKIDKSLLLAIVKVESNFNPNAKNIRSGASGLFQFMPSTYRGIISKYKIEDKGIFNIESNTLAGIYYVRDLLERHNNNVEAVLASYLGTYNCRYISLIKNYRQNF